MNTTTHRLTQTIGLGIAVMLTLSACGTFDSEKRWEPHIPASQFEAGTTSLSVISVGPWDEYSNRLTPSYSLTSKDALTEVLPDTIKTDERLLDALGISASVGLPSSTEKRTVAEQFSRNVPETGAATNTSSRTVDETRTSESGKVPDDIEALGLGERSAAALPGIISATSDTSSLGKDPFLKYKTATALYQEVKLLEGTVQDMARRYNTVPFLVRLQMNVTPYARHQPYDVYSTLSFFSKPPKNYQTYVAKGSVPGDEPSVPIVIPLVVTDNLESNIASRSRDILRQLAINLGGIQSGVAANVGADHTKERLDAILGRDFNSLYSISRVSDNTLRVRLGAAREATAGHAMVTRSHNISLVLLVPASQLKASYECNGNNSICEAPMVQIRSRSSLRHAIDGTELPLYSSKSQPNVHLCKRLVEVGIGRQQCLPKESVLIEKVQSGDWTGYDAEIKQWNLSEPQKYRLWVILAEAAANDNWAAASFDLPRKWPNLPPKNQEVVFFDDREKEITATLHYGLDLTADRLSASINIVDCKACSRSCNQEECVKACTNAGYKPKLGTSASCGHYRNYQIPAQDIKVVSPEVHGGYEKVIISFPSLYAWDLPGRKASEFAPTYLQLRLLDFDKWTDNERINLETSCKSKKQANNGDYAIKSDKRARCSQYRNITYIRKKKDATKSPPKEPVKLSSSVNTIVADGNNKGEVTIVITPTKGIIDAVELTVKNAELDTAPLTVVASHEEVAQLGKIKLTVKDTMALRLKFKNLIPGSTVTITPKATKSGKEVKGAKALSLMVSDGKKPSTLKKQKGSTIGKATSGG